MNPQFAPPPSTLPRPRGLVAFVLAVWATVALGCGGGAGPRFHIEASRSERGHIHLVRLVGTPFEMGLQHGALLADGLAEGVEFVETDPFFALALSLALAEGYDEEALQNSFPDVVEECQGMAEGARRAGVPGWTVDKCLLLAYGEVLIEHLGSQLGACSQFVARGSATVDGSLIHARNLDWGDIPYMMDHPTVFVRHPDGQDPWVAIAFPGSVAPYSGINHAGLSIASNENNAVDDIDHQGRSHQQMMRQLFQQATTFEEARAFLVAQDHLTAESFMVTDHARGQAGVFEMTANHMGVRELGEDGVVFMANHFVHPDMVAEHITYPPDASSRTRLQRLEQLVTPGGEDSRYGQIDLAVAISILRDTYNPYTGETHPADLFDGGNTLANNAALHGMVFLPQKRTFYVAMGQIPVLTKPFVGFHLDELFGLDPEAVAEPAEIP